MDQSLKAVFFVTSLQSGGLENYLLRFLQEKHQDFGEIVVFCKGGIGGQLEAKYKALPNVKIVKKKISFFNPVHYVQLYSYFSAQKFTVVCDFTGNFAGLIMHTAACAGVKKRVTFYRGSSDHFSTNGLKKIYNNYVHGLVYKYSTAILSNSEAAFQYFFSNIWKNDARFEVIYNGINPDDFVNEKNNLRDEFNIPANAFVVGHTGRMNVAKNHSTILEVTEQLINENKDIYFILCGNQVKNKLQPLVNKKKLDDRLLLFENRTDIPKFLNTMDCYYFPSITEGQPNALIEAMLMNKPIVASDIPSIKETVPQNLYSFLVNPYDVEGAKDKIMEIKKNGWSFNLQDWTIKTFNAKELFQKFYNRLK